MHRDLTISVVIPAYNEEEGVAAVIRRLPACVDEIVVANNNSTDRTEEVARELGAKVVRETRQGYGAAYKAGLAAATQDVIITMDADCTYPPEEIPGLMDRLIDDRLDFISAARFPLQDPRAMNFSNKLGNWVLTFTTWLLFGQKMADSQSGMWVFKRSLLSQFNLTSDQMSFSEELKIEAFTRKDIKARELPIYYKARIGESKLRLWHDGFSNLIFLFKKRISAWQRHRKD